MPVENNTEYSNITKKIWATYPVSHIRVIAKNGFIHFAPHTEYDTQLMRELIYRELDLAGITGEIHKKLIAWFDFNPITQERKLRYRRLLGVSNPDKIRVKLTDGTPVIVIATYDF
jgi:hypothetical protein